MFSKSCTLRTWGVLGLVIAFGSASAFAQSSDCHVGGLKGVFTSDGKEGCKYELGASERAILLEEENIFLILDTSSLRIGVLTADVDVTESRVPKSSGETVVQARRNNCVNTGPPEHRWICVSSGGTAYCPHCDSTASELIELSEQFHGVFETVGGESVYVPADDELVAVVEETRLYYVINKSSRQVAGVLDTEAIVIEAGVFTAGSSATEASAKQSWNCTLICCWYWACIGTQAQCPHCNKLAASEEP